ncbi:MAG: hypothetical protein ACI89L_002120 [Phycisphaerales bacterium]|jgi:hypothetical protein
MNVMMSPLSRTPSEFVSAGQEFPNRYAEPELEPLSSLPNAPTATTLLLIAME